MPSTLSLRPVAIAGLHIGGIASVRVRNAPHLGLVEHYIANSAELVDVIAKKLSAFGEILMFSYPNSGRATSSTSGGEVC